LNQSTSLLNVAKAVTTVAGLFIVATGAMGGALYVTNLFLSTGDATLDSAVAGAALAALGVGFGSALIWHGSRSLRKRASAPFRLPAIGWLLVLYILVLVAGQLIISFDIFPTLTFPPFHILAAGIPPLAILAFTSRAFKPASLRWREIIVHLSGGAFLSTTLAFLTEIVIGLLVLVIAFLVTALIPSGREFIESLADKVQNPTWLQNPENVLEILLFPPVAISIVLIFVILAPMIEELLKLLGVALMSYRRPARVQVFVWGLASGAGFALVENLFNTVLALDVWGFIMLLRVGGTAMHCLGTGLMALGWQDLLINRRLGRLIGAYALSLTIHALWNGIIIGIAGISVLATSVTGEITLALIGSVVIILLIALVGLTVALLVAIVVLTKRLQKGQSL
jgi:RsiW-degrading membrane proteinase PrsW (M82 family)